jgi:hypothetical protein
VKNSYNFDFQIMNCPKLRKVTSRTILHKIEDVILKSIKVAKSKIFPIPKSCQVISSKDEVENIMKVAQWPPDYPIGLTKILYLFDFECSIF